MEFANDTQEPNQNDDMLVKREETNELARSYDQAHQSGRFGGAASSSSQQPAQVIDLSDDNSS